MEKSYKLFVGGLPVRVDKDLIVAFFSTYGTVLSCKLKKNQQTGRSLGFAYLNVKEKEACDRLLTEAVEFQGRIIEVKPVWKKKELGDKLEEEKRKKLFVSNLPLELNNEDLVSYFSGFGNVQNAFIIKDPDTNRNKNYGYVIFKEVEDLEQVFSSTEPHMIRPGVELKLERCLNSAEIALLKQTNSYRSSMKSSFFHSPQNTYNRNSSPCDDFSSPERHFARSDKNHSYYRSNQSPAKTSMSPNYNTAAPGRSFKRSTFSLPKKRRSTTTRAV
jgi:RNA recognition motif-containing protein